jgi:hypothetical protein
MVLDGSGQFVVPTAWWQHLWRFWLAINRRFRILEVLWKATKSRTSRLYIYQTQIVPVALGVTVTDTIKGSKASDMSHVKRCFATGHRVLKYNKDAMAPELLAGSPNSCTLAVETGNPNGYPIWAHVVHPELGEVFTERCLSTFVLSALSPFNFGWVSPHGKSNPFSPDCWCFYVFVGQVMLCDISFPSSHLLHRNLQLLVWPAEYGILILDGYIGYISMAHAEKSPFWLFKSPGAGGLSFQSHQWWFIPRRKEMDELCKITPVISGSRVNPLSPLG